MSPHIEEAWRALGLADRDIHAFHVLKNDPDCHWEHADDFDRRVAALDKSEKLTSFLEDRSKETGDIPIEEIRKKHGM